MATPLWRNISMSLIVGTKGWVIIVDFMFELISLVVKRSDEENEKRLKL